MRLTPSSPPPSSSPGAMGDYQASPMDDLGVDGPEFTCDWFTCGLCGLQTSSIEGYVSHMILQERCVLHLCPSGAVRDLLLPRFSKRRKRRRNHSEEEAREEEEDVKERREGGGGGGGDTKVEVQAEEVEMGDVRRWKCQLCGLTFSRQAAILNHFKLQHRVGGISGSPCDNPNSRAPQVKEETAAAMAAAPVRHIIAVETQGSLDPMPQVQEESSKAWRELGCHRCGQIFKTGKILRAHISVVHSEGRPFQCDFQGCSYAFKTKGSLKRHQRRHTGERPFACQQCGRQFRESGSLTRHMQAQISCVRKSDAQIPLYGRTLPLHPPPHADRKPSVSLDIKFSLKQELSSAEEDPSTRLPTPSAAAAHLDESKAVLRSQLATGGPGGHMVKVESGGPSAGPPPLHVCKTEPQPPPPPPPSSTCSTPPPRPLENTGNGREEEEEEEEDIKPPSFLPDILRNSFTCPVCFKSYTQRPALALHIKLHLDELGDSCSECHRRFTSRQALGRHLSAHSSLRQFECGECGKTFKLLSHAKTHLLAHSSVKSVPCRYCPNLYKTKSARNMHERTHTSAPSFPCVECQRAFATKASLVRHLRTHTGEAPFSCRHCGRTFKEHGTLARHLRHKVPCAQQARMDRQLGGDVGIHLLPPSETSTIKDEGSGARVDEEDPASDTDQVSEGGTSSIFREREEEEEEEEEEEGSNLEWNEEEDAEEEEEEEEEEGGLAEGCRPPRILLMGKDSSASLLTHS
ncbi:transcription factor E4F1-like isoform X2 [Eriocheir sinensis]|uniref:transcription factor E4F1-like isoform X2 n=1 Tax=Eriocheir sinensis TaxID=95602 RepID=UPI0021C8463A|nr:transcription factor E4F1-like isoform X2 [Eriocheir sinensis]